MEEIKTVEIKYENAHPLNFKARVWNTGHETYREDYKGRKIEIPAGGHIVMDEASAHDFLSEYTHYEKPLRLERIQNGKIAEKLEEKASQEAANTCQLCGFKAANDHGLKIHTASRHPDAKPARPAE